jgi:pimeloyl-ACP methyl ester carboxylesterase
MLLVDMHGGVGRPEALTHEELDQMKFFWGKQAEEHGFFLALPSGQTGAEWWTEVGAGNVLAILDTVKREYDVDENRVFATGFSDGGSGCYYLALTHPTPFAGFVALNGHPSVAQLGGLQGHVGNLRNTPIYAVNTENDSLYPSKGLAPFYAALANLRAPVVYRDLPGWSHNPMYLEGENGERPRIWNWIEGVRRNPRPERIWWAGAAGAPSRVHWLANVRVGETESDADLPDPNPDLPPGRPRIGVQVDQTFAGPGVKVSEVIENTPASAIGLEPGDVIVRMGDEEIPDLRALRAALGRLEPGRTFEMTITRPGMTIRKTGRFADAEPRPVFRRGRPSGNIEATARGNVFEVRSAGITAFDLYLDEAMVDLDEPIVVKVNGQVAFEGRVSRDLRFMFERAARDNDRTTLYAAKLTVRVP